MYTYLNTHPSCTHTHTHRGLNTHYTHIHTLLNTHSFIHNTCTTLYQKYDFPKLGGNVHGTYNTSLPVQVCISHKHIYCTPSDLQTYTLYTFSCVLYRDRHTLTQSYIAHMHTLLFFACFSGIRPQVLAASQHTAQPSLLSFQQLCF